MRYTCPMHSDVNQSSPGKCPKCGMKLVHEEQVQSKIDTPTNSYRPLIIIFLLLLVTTLALSFRDLLTESFHIAQTMAYFMGGFFLVFSGFKLLDLKGFAEGYAMYDLLAKRVFAYGYIYPFFELFLGLCYAIRFVPPIIIFLTILLMIFSGLGVAIKVLKHEKFQCACLGTFLKIPLTKVTLIEDFGMAAMALIMLVI